MIACESDPSELVEMAERTLPDYDNPPAQETWMAFAFVPLKWSIPHFGAFWSEVRADYPRFEVHPPIGEFNFEFKGMGPEAIVNLPVRCWLINDESNRLIQIQSNFFCHNWRRPNPAAPYLHYGELKPVFEKEWRRFCDFAGRHELGVPNVLSCEVSYINHLDRGIGWENFSDLSTVFPSVGSFQGRDFLGKPETVIINGSYVMPSNEGRLRVQVQPAIRQKDGKEIIQLTITGSCRPGSSNTTELMRCLDFCREWVVRGFDDLTSHEMHKIWRKK
jgi:uncharacterized protein (TIGR04255 family)